MAFALTLVSASSGLSAAHLAVLERYLADHKISIERNPRWLADHKAADVILSNALDKSQSDELRQEFQNAQIDIFCLSTTNRRKSLLCADMESTIIAEEMLEELADVLKIKDKIAAITDRAMNGEIDFTQSLKDRTALLAGLPAQTLIDFIPKMTLNGGAKSLVKTMAANGALCVLVTGGFTIFSDPIAREVGFHHHHANAFDIQSDTLTGKLAGDILDPDAKLHFLNKYCDKLGIKPSDAMAIGDGANDLPMLTTAGFGVGYRPKPILQKTIINQIHHCDLTAALYAQGYSENDIQV